MIAPLAKLIDWSAVQAATLMMPANLSNPRIEESTLDIHNTAMYVNKP
jgi:hypothetical protein